MEIQDEKINDLLDSLEEKAKKENISLKELVEKIFDEDID